MRIAPPPAGPTVTAHRAGAALGIENSLAALERSIAVGAPCAEIDVQLSSDGVPVVFHDEDLARITGVEKRVQDIRYPDLPALPNGEPIPALAQFLAAARGRICLTIELKDTGFEALAPTVVKLLHESASLDQVLVCSFSAALIEQVRRLAPRLRCGIVIDEAGELPEAGRAHFVSVAYESVNASMVKQAHARGLAVHAWTVNATTDMERLLLLGVDNLITDDPVLGLRSIHEFERLGPWRKQWLRWRAARAAG